MPIIMTCLLVPLLFLLAGLDINGSSLNNLHNLLIGISGAVFTVMSIWVGFLYPNVLNTLKENHGLKASLKDIAGDTSKLKIIVMIIIKSAATIIYAVLAAVALGVGDSLSFSTKSVVQDVVQFSSLFFVALQVSAIASLISINIGFITAIENKVVDIKRKGDE